MTPHGQFTISFEQDKHNWWHLSTIGNVVGNV